MSDEPPPPTQPDRLEEQRGKPGPGSDDFDPKDHIWDGRDWWSSDREFWWDGSQWQPKDVPHQAPAPVGGRRRSIFASGEVWLGFGGAIVGNVLLAVLVGTLASQVYGQLGSLIGGAPWVINLGAVVLFAIVRPRIAVGMLLAYGVAFGLALIAGIFIAIICFSGGGGVP